MENYNIDKSTINDILSKWARVAIDLSLFRDYFRGDNRTWFQDGNVGAVAALEYDMECHREILKFLQSLYNEVENNE